MLISIRKSVRTIKMEGKALNQGAISSVAVYFITFTLIFAASFLLVFIGRQGSDNEFHSGIDDHEQYGTEVG